LLIGFGVGWERGCCARAGASSGGGGGRRARGRARSPRSLFLAHACARADAASVRRRRGVNALLVGAFSDRNDLLPGRARAEREREGEGETPKSAALVFRRCARACAVYSSRERNGGVNWLRVLACGCVSGFCGRALARGQTMKSRRRPPPSRQASPTLRRPSPLSRLPRSLSRTIEPLALA
jgi:hypothetical protein